jgi:hypothetical protein
MAKPKYKIGTVLELLPKHTTDRLLGRTRIVVYFHVPCEEQKIRGTYKGYEYSLFLKKDDYLMFCPENKIFVKYYIQYYEDPNYFIKISEPTCRYRTQNV